MLRPAPIYNRRFNHGAIAVQNVMAGHDDVLLAKVDIFEVSAWSHEDRNPIGHSINRALNG
jgi:hypothetical protein